jgi:8-oxo-dGTP diphosphatase
MINDYLTVPEEARWRNQRQPAPIVISIIQRSTDDSADCGTGSYLLIRRIEEPYRGYWALVGGKWDFGESLSEAALREVQEETGLNCHFVSLQGVANERAAVLSDGRKGAAHFLLFVCLVDACHGKASEKDEGEVAWFTRGEIEELKAENRMIPSDYAMLTQFIEARPLPYAEVEMESAGEDPDRVGETRLVTFEINE